MADEMGLGKALSMISLIASGKEESVTSRLAEGCETHILRDAFLLILRTGQSRATLVIVPSSLLQTWETELKTHTHANTLRCLKHYGNNRLQREADLADQEYDVVLTTLMTVTHEYRKRACSPSLLFNTCWYRVVIDEAHCIRNWKTLSARAVCSIRASRRWAVTGTPIQNRLGDFASLLRFLDFDPYANRENFNRDIVSYWNVEEGGESTARLKRLARAIMLRRSKEMIELPPRTNVVVSLRFQVNEANEYRRLSTTVIRTLDDVLEGDQLPTRSYANALTRINLLRRFCDIGMQACTNLGFSAVASKEGQSHSWTAREAQEAFENLTGFGPLNCSRCGLEDRTDLGVADDLSSKGAQLTQCCRLICRDCSFYSTSTPTCDHDPPCPVASVAVSANSSGRQTPETDPISPSSELPTKIRAAIEDIKPIQNEKRYRAVSICDLLIVCAH